MHLLKKFKNLFWSTIIIAIGYYAYTTLSASATPLEAERESLVNLVPSVLTKKAQAAFHHIAIPVLGTIEAQQSIDLFSEVNGIFEKGNRPFLSATPFKKGDVLARINADQFNAQLRANKSSLKARIVPLLAIIKLDFPESFEQWTQYLKSISPDEKLKKLPVYKSEKESLFIISKGIEEQYFNIKSQEELFRKYSIIAPFSGVVTDVMIKEGALVSPGQRLATFIGNRTYDIIAEVKKEELKWIKKGDAILLKNNKKAIIKRIDNQINTQTQLVKIYATINDASLLHGDFIQGKIMPSQKVEGIWLDRQLITPDDYVFIHENGKAKKIKVKKIFSNKEQTLITGIEASVQIIQNIQEIQDGQAIKVQVQELLTAQ
jgi:multidrug efflux pump subunit AcrA (membrane-fusion protein)